MQTKSVTVSSTKMDKTVVVKVHIYKSHPKYKKKYRTTKKFYAHDPDNSCQKGDLVTIEEHRPLSKKKHWKVISINDQEIATEKKPTSTPTATLEPTTPEPPTPEPTAPEPETTEETLEV